MTDSVAELVAELKALRKGRGIHAPHIGDRIGPAIRAICAIAENEDAATVRQKLTVRLKELAARLPWDLRIGVTAAFGLADDLHTQFYKDRLEWAEAKLERNSRTVRRRIDEAIARLAEMALPGVDPSGNTHRAQPGSGWYNREIRQSLVLDQPTPDALELRRIVSEADGLDELDLALTITAPTPMDPSADADITVIFGGRLRRPRMESSERIGFRLLLPQPLNLGDQHEFALRHRVSHELVPHFVSVPRHRCDLCEIRVRFAEDRLPTRLEKLDGVLQRDVADPVTKAEPLELDSIGEVLVRFTNLTPNLAYGVRWTLPD